MTRQQTSIDISVIEASKKGNKLAQYTLYNKYSRAMYNLAYRMMNRKEDAEDILQDAFTDAFTRLDTFRHESTFGAWIKSIVINKCINQLKKKNKELITDKLPEQPGEYDEKDMNEFKGDIKKVFKAIEMLPDGYRLVFTLYLLEGYDHSEIAEIMSISESTSKTQYHRARKKLRQLLAKEDLVWTN